MVLYLIIIYRPFSNCVGCYNNDRYANCSLRIHTRVSLSGLTCLPVQ